MQNDYKYAQVLVDIPSLELDKRTFSYLIPDDIKDKLVVGSPVSVPFGRQDPVFAYVVGFTNYIPEGIKIKPIFDLMDEKPLFDLKYLQFLEWLSSYYMSSLMSAITTAVPAGLWSSTKRTVSLLKELNKEEFNNLNTLEQKVCSILTESKSGCFSPTTIANKTKIPRAKVYNTIRKLAANNILNMETIIPGLKVKPKQMEFVKLISLDTKNKRQKEILEILANTPEKELETKDLLKEAKTTRTTIKKIAKEGLVEIYYQEDYRTPLKRFNSLSKDSKLDLTGDQQTALKFIKDEFDKEEYHHPVLLYGVTGSGKTEVYFQLMEEVLLKGKSVIFLVPEITLTSQISAKMVARFGSDIVGIWHSGLTTGERLDIWRRIKSGQIRIVLGARSAVFAPVEDLGLIILDEEHESSYKQDTPAPRYNARDVAIERAKRYDAHVLLGSATPDIPTYYRAKEQSKIATLPYRINQRPMAQIGIVDMKAELESGNKSIFSRVLSFQIQERLEKKEQVILLINRRGFTTYVFCRACGFVANCKHCSIPLIYHNTSGELRCHYCNYKQSNYEICPECSSPHIKHYGAGTQKVEEEVKRKFPGAKCLRLDSDITTQKNAFYDIIEEFSAQKADILIGTQMVAKGLDIPGVTLVGVLASDSAFTFPDYRSMERGFQLLTQVAGRAGRGEKLGKVIFQCYSPNILPITCAQKQDYFSFYSFEIYERERYKYPPFCQLIRIVISSDSFDLTFEESINLTHHINDNIGDLEEKVEILGPSECVIQKIQNKFRMQILIKNLLDKMGHKIISKAMNTYKSKDTRIIIDVDPLNML